MLTIDEILALRKALTPWSSGFPSQRITRLLYTDSRKDVTAFVYRLTGKTALQLIKGIKMQELCPRTFAIWKPGRTMPGVYHSYYYTGKMPGTGEYKCYLCGQVHPDFYANRNAQDEKV